MLEKEREETQDRMRRSLRSFTESWCEKIGKEVIFDKSRAWNVNSLLLNDLYPDAKQLVLVRDLRNIYASVEKQHKKTPFLDDSNAKNKTLLDRANSMFSPDGLIGSCIVGVEDLIRRRPKGIVFIQFETFAQNPESVMEKIYAEIGEKPFKHDFDHIENTANDPDGHYLLKFPHSGNGKVQQSDPAEWKKYMTPDLADKIMNRFKEYNQFFGYN